MNKLITTYNGGMPVVLDDIRWNDDAYRSAMTAILRAFGTDFIVQGCVVTGNAISAGYIMLGGQLLQVDAHTKTGNGYYQLVTTYNSAGTKTFRNSVPEDTYQQNRGLATASSGALAFNGATLVSLLVLKSRIGSTANAVPQVGGLDLSASLPLVTDANSQLNTLAVAAFRTLIDVYSKGESLTNRGGLLTKVISIGDWVMNVNSSKLVAHGLDYTKIRTMLVTIRDDDYDNPTDANGQLHNLTDYNSGSCMVKGVNILLSCVGASWSGGGSSYTNTGYNRGFIVIQYIP